MKKWLVLILFSLFGAFPPAWGQTSPQPLAIEVIGEGLQLRSSLVDRFRQDFYITLKNRALDTQASSVVINSRPEQAHFFGNYVSQTPRLAGEDGLFSVQASGAPFRLDFLGDEAEEISVSLRDQGIHRIDLVVMDVVDSTLSLHSQSIQETGRRSLLRARASLEYLLAQGFEVELHILNHMRSATQTEVISGLSREARNIWCRALL